MTKMCRTLYVIAALEADEYDADLTFDEVADWDYTEICIIDADSDKVLYHDDTVHGNPGAMLDGIVRGIKTCGQEVALKPIVVFVAEGARPSDTEAVREALAKYITERE